MTMQGEGKHEGTSFMQTLKRKQPELYEDARQVWLSRAHDKEDADVLRQQMQEASRVLFKPMVWKSIVQHILLDLGRLPAVCDDLNTMSWSTVQAHFGAHRELLDPWLDWAFTKRMLVGI